MSINFTEAKKIPIEAFMAAIGQMPKYNKNGKLLYHAPYRVDNNPSLLVWKNTNRWRDMSFGYGGDVVDLVVKLTSDGSYTTAVKILQSHSYEKLIAEQCDHTESAVVELQYFANSILKVSRITNPKLVEYAGLRGISYDILEKYCQEVIYKNSRGHFFAIGFPNDKGGFAIRNSRFKGAISPVAITTIREHTDYKSCVLFEGFFDFLAFMEFNKCMTNKVNADYIILNSLSNLNGALSELSRYEDVYCCLDTDEAGQDAFECVRSHCPKALDLSFQYKGCKDLNEFLALIKTGLYSNNTKLI